MRYAVNEMNSLLRHLSDVHLNIEPPQQYDVLCSVVSDIVGVTVSAVPDMAAYCGQAVADEFAAVRADVRAVMNSNRMAKFNSLHMLDDGSVPRLPDERDLEALGYGRSLPSSKVTVRCARVCACGCVRKCGCGYVWVRVCA